MPQNLQYVISTITPPNASIPGVVCMMRGIYNNLRGWESSLRGIELLQAEWLDKPGPHVIPRLAAALRSLMPEELEGRRDDHGQLISDWREWSEREVRLVVCSNYWASAAQKLDEHKISPDRLVTIRAGNMAGEGARNMVVGRMYLLDQLRDAFPKLTVNLPAERTEDYPTIVSAHELRASMREVSHRPRLLDEETQAPGLDRGDVLLLTLALGVEDLMSYGPASTDSINDPNTKLWHFGSGCRR